MVAEKSRGGIICNSQSFNTMPCLASINAKKYGSNNTMDKNMMSAIITLLRKALLVQAWPQLILF
jgi:hypothetical protein